MHLLLQSPPPEERVQVDSEKVYPLAPNVSLVRGTCSCKLRMEVEYMLKHGTSDNCYLIQVSHGHSSKETVPEAARVVQAS